MDKSIGILDKDYTLWVKELEKLYPEKVEGTMPSIKEIEAKLDGNINS